MPSRKLSRQDVTPAGKLDEARLHFVLGYQVAQAAIVTNAVFDKQVREPFDLRPVDYTVLTLIAENPGTSPARLARALAVTAPNLTVWVDRLCARGLVQREKSATDGRAQVLHASPKGAALARQATQSIVQGERAALAHLSAGELAILGELLHKVACARQDALR